MTLFLAIGFGAGMLCGIVAIGIALICMPLLNFLLLGSGISAVEVSIMALASAMGMTAIGSV